MILRVVGLFAIVLLIGGCAAPLPKYPPMEPPGALALMKQRDAVIHSLRSECDLTLTDAGGSSVSFDAAIVAEWPDRLRLRAWKFGHAAFDLTYTPEGLWMYIPEEAKRHAGQNANFSITAEQFGRVWKMLGPASLDGAAVVQSDPRILTVRRSPDTGSPDGGVLECDIDRETLTTRTYRFVDPQGMLRQTLSMTSYRSYPVGAEQVVWPQKIAAEGESGRISVRLIDPEFNGEVPTGVFTPPARAIKQP